MPTKVANDKITFLHLILDDWIFFNDIVFQVPECALKHNHIAIASVTEPYAPKANSPKEETVKIVSCQTWKDLFNSEITYARHLYTCAHK